MDVVTIVQTLGFPIGVTLILLYDKVTQQPKLTATLERLCVLIENCPKK